jgi:hypothetical protein
MNRTLTIIASAVVLIGIGVFVYFFFFNESPAVTVGTQGGGLPLAGQGALPTDTSGTTGAG